METKNNQSENSSPDEPQTTFQQELPNASVVLILGIIALIISFFNSLVGLVTGIVSLVMARNTEKLYNQTPRLYTLSSLSNMRSGKTCAIIGIVLAILKIILIGIILALLGTLIPWGEISHNSFSL